MRLGVHSMTVTGIESPVSVNTRVMPTLRPIIPIVMVLSSYFSGPGSIDADLNFDAGRQVELGQGVHSLLGRVDDLHEPLVRADLILIARVLVGMRGYENGKTFFAGR